MTAPGTGMPAPGTGITAPGTGMLYLVIHAHPDPQSYSAAIRDRAVAALEDAGHEVELIDLYRPRYQPVMTGQEHVDYYVNGKDHPDQVTAAHISALQRASALVFIYPTWWAGLPAILKGWLDRTLLPDVAFRLSPGTDGNGPNGKTIVRPALHNIKRLIGISTYGSGRLEVRLLGDAGRRTITRTVRMVCATRCKTTWLGLHKLDASTSRGRAHFLDRVDAELRKLK